MSVGVFSSNEIKCWKLNLYGNYKVKDMQIFTEELPKPDNIYCGSIKPDYLGPRSFSKNPWEYTCVRFEFLKYLKG